MRLSVLALLAISMLVVSACLTDNDENTVNSIPKYHSVYPIFHVKIDNGYKTFAIDSILLTVEPTVGWLEPVYTDANGYIGTLGAGTYILDIDTTINDADTLIDTTSVVYGFSPSTAYTFRFTRDSAFTWIDSVRINYARDIDSSWIRLSVDTQFVSRTPDPDHQPVSRIDSVALIGNPLDTILNPPDSVYLQEVLIGKWFNIPHVITDPDDTIGFPPTLTYLDTLPWGFWNKIDSFFLPVDSAGLCDLATDTIIDTIGYDSSVTPPEVITDTTINDFFVIIRNAGPDTVFPIITVDTIRVFIDCHPDINQAWYRFYPTHGWGDMDTTLFFATMDSVKNLTFQNGLLSVHNTESGATREPNIYLINNGSTTPADSMTLRILLPPVEVFPDYSIIIRDEN